jgi:hypothetical protein
MFASDFDSDFLVSLGCFAFTLGSGLSFVGGFFLVSVFAGVAFLFVLPAVFFRVVFLGALEPMTSSKSASSSSVMVK